MGDERYSDVRDKFFSGELHASPPSSGPVQPLKRIDTVDPSADDLFHRIDRRLRHVVVKSCESSAPACKIVESFENFLVDIFASRNPDSSSHDFWKDVLLEAPNVVRAPDGEVVEVNFLFDGESSSGGFHRILVHAVSHFHCLKAKTSSIQNARTLTVSGTVRGEKLRVLDYLAAVSEKRQ